jgi:Cys-tRNA(Pro)/Cys-tRNA(Cys) deacylase
MKKTIAMRLLEGRGIPYELFEYSDVVGDATMVAQAVGVPAGQLFKTLVVVRDRGKPFLVMVPSDRQLDLKKMAKAVGEKKLMMAGHDEAEQLTKLQTGGISALALLNRGFEIVLDKSARHYERILVSAGERGMNLGVPVAGLVELTGAAWHDVT